MNQKDLQEIKELHLADLIILKDSSVMRRSMISRAAWLEKGRSGEKYIEVVFADPSITDNSKRYWELSDEEAFDFWEQYTGQRVSWDTRPEPEKG